MMLSEGVESDREEESGVDSWTLGDRCSSSIEGVADRQEP